MSPKWSGNIVLGNDSSPEMRQHTFRNDNGCPHNGFLNFFDTKADIANIREVRGVTNDAFPVLVYNLDVVRLSSSNVGVTLTLVGHCWSCDDNTCVIFVLESLAEYIHMQSTQKT